MTMSAMTAQPTLGERWVALAQLNDTERPAAMRPLLDEVLTLGLEQRLTALLEMVKAEYGLDVHTLHRFTASRLRAWLAVAAESRDAAQTLARGYDDVFNLLPGETAMRRATIVQSVARTELTGDEIARLLDLLPSFARQIPRDAIAMAAAVAGPKKAPTAEHARWRFWTHSG